jgi:hypothetical protein
MIFIWGWRGWDFRYLFCLIFLRRLTSCHMICCCISWDSNLGSRVLLVGYLVAFWVLGLRRLWLMGSVRFLLISVPHRVLFFRTILLACFINDVCDHVRNCRFHIYADDLQIYTVKECGDVNRMVALVNGHLQRILDWSRIKFLILNASKTQALLVSWRIRLEDVSCDVIWGGDSVWFSDVVKNLGLYEDGRLSWRKQVSYVVSRTFSTLFYRFQRYSSRDLRIQLVRSLIEPIVLYSLDSAGQKTKNTQ